MDEGNNMKKAIYLCLILFSLNIIVITALGETQISNNYIIVGHIYPPNDVLTISLENLRTSEIFTVDIRNGNNNLKEYLFDLANLKQGWRNNDNLLLNYNGTKTVLVVDSQYVGIQKDINAPTDYIPIVIITGAVLIIVVGGTYYYIKSKDNNI